VLQSTLALQNDWHFDVLMLQAKSVVSPQSLSSTQSFGPEGGGAGGVQLNAATAKPTQILFMAVLTEPSP
jgi:hypothetical protein